MKIISTVDAMLRDRDALYDELAKGEGLGQLSGKLVLIFVFSTAIYGFAMGSFRWLHPEFYLSDFELKTADGQTFEGKVAGMSASQRLVYTTFVSLPVGTVGTTIRFNVSAPTDAYEVSKIDEEKGYTRIELADTVLLSESEPWRIPMMSAAKAPMLFLLTLTACSLALYVLNLAFGLRLYFRPTMTLILFALSATGTMLAVFVPIVWLFSAVTDSYNFVKNMHVLVFGIAGLFGLKVLWEGLSKLAPQGSSKIKGLLVSWLLLYCMVGGQVAWTLKPWLGTPYVPNTPPFRVSKGNIYVSFFESAGQMMDH